MWVLMPFNWLGLSVIYWLFELNVVLLSASLILWLFYGYLMFLFCKLLLKKIVAIMYHSPTFYLVFKVEHNTLVLKINCRIKRFNNTLLIMINNKGSWTMFSWFKKLLGKKEEKSRYVKMYVDIPFEEIQCPPFDYSAMKINKEESEKEEKATADS